MTTTIYTKQELKEHGMKPHAIKAFLKLQKMKIAVMLWQDSSRGHFWINTEGINNETEMHLDYYQNYWGSELLQEILTENGLYFEWYDSAVACVYDE